MSLFIALMVSIHASAALAVTPGLVNDFSVTLEKWQQGGPPSGGFGLFRRTIDGPLGLNDAYAEIVSDGLSTHGRIVMFNDAPA